MISVTSAPRAASSRQSRYPILPLERLPTKRTGSRSSYVGPAVTTTLPARERPAPRQQQALGRVRRRRPARRAGPCQSSRTPGSPRRARRSARRAPAALPGSAAPPGARACSCSSPAPAAPAPSSRGYSDDRKSSAMPCANLPMMFAVAGATSSRAMSEAIEMCSMSALAPGVHWSVITRRRVIASKVTAPTNRRADRVMMATTSCPCFCRQARDLDRLVGADAAGDAEGDESHGSTRNVSMMRGRHRFHPAEPAPARPRRSTAAAPTAGSSIVVDDDVVVVGHGADLAAARPRAAAESAPRCPCCGLAAAPRAPRRTAAGRRCRRAGTRRRAPAARPARRSRARGRARARATRSVVAGRRAVEIAEHVGVLQELAVRDHRLEALAADEIIVDAIAARPRAAGAT